MELIIQVSYLCSRSETVPEFFPCQKNSPKSRSLQSWEIFENVQPHFLTNVELEMIRALTLTIIICRCSLATCFGGLRQAAIAMSYLFEINYLISLNLAYIYL